MADDCTRLPNTVVDAIHNAGIDTPHVLEAAKKAIAAKRDTVGAV